MPTPPTSVGLLAWLNCSKVIRIAKEPLMINLIFGSTYFTTFLICVCGEAVWQFKSLKMKTRERRYNQLP